MSKVKRATSYQTGFPRAERKLTPEYAAWQGMRQRCLNPNNSRFKDYGGRGIKICKRWDSFQLFVKDLGFHPGRGYSLGRIKNHKGYLPTNCRWETGKQQARNRRSVSINMKIARKIRKEYDEKEETIRSLAKKYSLGKSTVFCIIKGETWKE